MEELDKIKYDGSAEDCLKFGSMIQKYYQEEGKEAPLEALNYSLEQYKKKSGKQVRFWDLYR